MGQGLASTANSTRVMDPAMLETINENGRLPPADKSEVDSQRRAPTTSPSSSYAIAATQTNFAGLGDDPDKTTWPLTCAVNPDSSTLTVVFCNVAGR